ncbi:MAG TPA: hypothetical protein PLZ10_16210, partial [Chitinophagaceae bacterium]|nr:hypothetical protein [Chitinophagaceae bacterium]
MYRSVFLLILALLQLMITQAQPVMKTGGQKMPDEWIDSSTGHRMIRLTRRAGNNYSFYFHNNPFIGNKMIFYGTDFLNTSKNDSVKVEISNISTGNKQIYTVDLATMAIEQVTNRRGGMNGEIVAPQSKLVYYQVRDSVFSTHIETKQTKLIYIFPADFKASITSLNADESLLGGAWSSDAEKEIFRKNPGKSSYFNLIYEAKLPRTLF